MTARPVAQPHPRVEEVEMAGTAHATQTKAHWTRRLLPEPPRTQRVSRWTKEDRDELLEEWLREESVRNTYEGD